MWRLLALCLVCWVASPAIHATRVHADAGESEHAFRGAGSDVQVGQSQSGARVQPARFVVVGLPRIASIAGARPACSPTLRGGRGLGRTPMTPLRARYRGARPRDPDLP